jgi:hypothetical protein
MLNTNGEKETEREIVEKTKINSNNARLARQQL